MDLKNKTILITGASDGIGREIAFRLSGEKASLILLGRNETRLQDVKRKCLERGAKEVFTHAFDLSDRNVVTDHLEKIRNTHSDISVIVNNAGIWQKLGDVDQINHDEIERLIGTNLTGLIKLTNTLLPVLRKQKEAAIINISSMSGYKAQSGQALYSASKYGVMGFTDVLREDLKDTHIRVACIYQGGTNTKMFEKAGEDWPDERYESMMPASGLAEVVTFMLTRPIKVWISEVKVASK